MKKILIVFALLVAAVLSARDFKEYHIRKNVNAYDDLEYLDTVDGSPRYLSDEMCYYCGVVGDKLIIMADEDNNILSKTIVCNDRGLSYAFKLFDVWSDRLIAVYPERAVFIDGRILMNSRMLEEELKEFFLSGTNLSMLFTSERGSTMSLLNVEQNDDYTYDIYVIMKGIEDEE